MSLSSLDIARIANLARLDLDPTESLELESQINQFLKIVKTMLAVDTTGIDPMAHPLAAIQDVKLRLREDLVSESDHREENMQNAPATEKGLFLVPKVME